MKIIVPFAEGLEEIEAVTIVDVLRRAELNVTTAALGPNPVTGSHGISITADTLFSHCSADDFDCIVLPGGMPGSGHLKESSEVLSMLRHIHEQGGYIAAICAAPMVLGEAGLLEGKKATCYPGFEKYLKNADCTNTPVAVDGKIITGRGPGCAIPFALKLVEIFKGSKISEELRGAMQVYWM